MRLRGFTLLELLVTVAIVGILTAVAVPSYIGYRSRARNAAAETDAGAFRIAEESVLVEFGAYTAKTPCLCRFAFNPQVVNGQRVLMEKVAPATAVAYTSKFAHPGGTDSFKATQERVFGAVDCTGDNCTDDIAQVWASCTDCPACDLVAACP